MLETNENQLKVHFYILQVKVLLGLDMSIPRGAIYGLVSLPFLKIHFQEWAIDTICSVLGPLLG